MNFFSRETSVEGIDFIHPTNLALLQRDEPTLTYADDNGNTLHLSVSNMLHNEECLGCIVSIQHLSEWQENDTEIIVVTNDGKLFAPRRKWGFQSAEIPLDYHRMLIARLDHYNAWVRIKHDIERESMYDAIGMTYEWGRTKTKLKEVIDHTSRAFISAIER